MHGLIHHIISESAKKAPEATALIDQTKQINYQELEQLSLNLSYGLLHLGLQPQDRVAVYLPKQVETVTSLFGTAFAGGVMVPINPSLKSRQVEHILIDSGARILITSRQRVSSLGGDDFLTRFSDRTFIIVDITDNTHYANHKNVVAWEQLKRQPCQSPTIISSDIAALLYTSGSTGQAKGVVLSHNNLVEGAKSVSRYLNNQSSDRLLVVLPLSFDYGLSQLTTAFLVGAQVVLHNYLLPKDVIKQIVRYKITGIAAVPPIWNQLTNLDWPETINEHLRYITNSGGVMPQSMLATLRKKLPRTLPYLMYGLTEAFRSTYLDPAEIDRRPTSIGKAIPNAEVMVLREDGTLCSDNEPGELVHRGPLVSLGYWNSPEKTAERFKQWRQRPELSLTETVVWSGDIVTRDEEGFLYFVSRRDEMIKSSGFRISPNEIESVIESLDECSEVAAFGVPHPTLEQAIIVLIQLKSIDDTIDVIQKHCVKELPNYMHPKHFECVDSLPKNPNGKIDRSTLKKRFENFFTTPLESDIQ